MNGYERFLSKKIFRKREREREQHELFAVVNS